MRISFFLVVLAFPLVVVSQIQKAPERKEGEGPWSQLIIRGVVLVDGTGAPPVGPVDIVVEKNRIKEVKVVGSPGIAIDTAKRPKLLAGGKPGISWLILAQLGHRTGNSLERKLQVVDDFRECIQKSGRKDNSRY